MASPLPWGERVRVRGNDLIITPTLILPPASAEAASRRQASRGGEFFRELDAPQLCCGVLHFFSPPSRFHSSSPKLNLFLSINFNDVNSSIETAEVGLSVDFPF